MAYKFFSQQLLAKNVLNLNDVFPEQQKLAKEVSNVSYDLTDIVLYLRDVTKDFSFYDAKYIDLDNAIRSIVSKYYKKENKPNPFEQGIDEKALQEFDEGIVPKEAFIVDDSGLKSKGVAKPAKKEKKLVTKTALPEPKAAEPVAEPTGGGGFKTPQEEELYMMLWSGAEDEETMNNIRTLTEFVVFDNKQDARDWYAGQVDLITGKPILFDYDKYNS